MRLNRAFAVALGSATMLAGGLAAPAMAEAPASPPVEHTIAGQVQDFQTPGGTDAGCVQAYEHAGKEVGPKDCTLLIDQGNSDPSAISPSDHAAMGNLQSQNGTKLGDVSAASLLCSTWWQDIHSGAGVWKEKHIGKYCWNGSDVWIWAKGGYHYCDQGYGIGYDIKVTTCDEYYEPANTAAGYFRKNLDNFKVYFLYQGFPVSNAYSMWVNVWPNGNATYHYVY